MGKYRKIIPAAIFTASALLGIGAGYLIFGPMSMVAMQGSQNTQHHSPPYPVAEEEPEPSAPQAEPTEFQPPPQAPPQPQNNTQPNSTEDTAAPSPEEPLHRYLVTTHGGYIVVYYATLDGKAGDTLRSITTTSVTSLAPEEQSKLERGILIYTEEALVRILEAYGS